jgi:hypothetical protein
MRVILFFIFLSLMLGCGSETKYIKIDFDDFERSTNLRLNSYIHDSTDCGEWGGHNERISIYKIDGQLEISFTREKSDCSEGMPFHKPLPNNIPLEFHGSLTKEKQEWVEDYIEKLFKHKPNENRQSNAPNRYEVQLETGFLTKVIKIDDHDNSWLGYETFRNKLINN